jgi:hypothetical protein
VSTPPPESFAKRGAVSRLTFRRKIIICFREQNSSHGTAAGKGNKCGGLETAAP